MRHAAADWCFLAASGLEPAAYYRRLPGLGYTGVEMVAPAHRPLARDAGLSLVTMSMPDLDRGMNQRSHHAWLLPGIRAGILEAHRDGVECLILFSGRRGHLSEQAGRDACILALQAVAREAEQAQVTLLLEVLNEQDHPDQQCSRLAYAAAVVGAVASPRVRILYDLYHACRMGDDPLAWDLGLLPLIGHLHLAACEGRSCPRPGTTPAYPPIVARLEQAGYSGWWGQEFIPTGDPLVELAEARVHIDPAASGAPHPGCHAV